MKPNPTPDPLLTVEEVSQIIRLTPRRVREKIRSGELPATRPLGRKWLIRRSDLARLLDAGQKETTP